MCVGGGSGAEQVLCSLTGFEGSAALDPRGSPPCRHCDHTCGDQYAEVAEVSDHPRTECCCHRDWRMTHRSTHRPRAGEWAQKRGTNVSRELIRVESIIA